MQTVGVNILPVLCRQEMTQPVFVAVGSNLRVAGCTGGEEHQDRIISAGGILRPLKFAAICRQLTIKVMPARTGTAGADQGLDRLALLHCPLHMLGHISVTGADNGADAGCVKSVHIVMLQQLVGCRDCNCPQLMQRHNGEPELIVPLQHQHHPVPLLDAQGAEVIGGHIGVALHIRKGKAALGHIVGNMQHCQLVRGLFRNLVHNIKAEVEGVRIVIFDAGQMAEFIRSGCHKLIRNRMQQPCLVHIGEHTGLYMLLVFGHTLSVWIHDNCIDLTVLAAHCNFIVGSGAVVVNGITRVKDFTVVTDEDLHAALHHNIKFLTLMGRHMQRLVQRLLGIRDPYKEGFADLVPELGRQTVVGKALPPHDGQSLAGSGYGVAGNLGAFTLHHVRDFHTAGLGAFVDKRKAEVTLSCLQRLILLHGHIRALCHFLHGKSHVLPHCPDTLCNLFDCKIHICFHRISSFLHSEVL